MIRSDSLHPQPGGNWPRASCVISAPMMAKSPSSSSSTSGQPWPPEQWVTREGPSLRVNMPFVYLGKLPCQRLFSTSCGVSESATCEAIVLAVIHALREERTRQGLSMDRLATKAGLSKGMISLVERDLRNPTFYTLVRIARALKLDFGEVFEKATAQVSKGQKK